MWKFELIQGGGHSEEDDQDLRCRVATLRIRTALTEAVMSQEPGLSQEITIPLGDQLLDIDDVYYYQDNHAAIMLQDGIPAVSHCRLRFVLDPICAIASYTGTEVIGYL